MCYFTAFFPSNFVVSSSPLIGDGEGSIFSSLSMKPRKLFYNNVINLCSSISLNIFFIFIIMNY